MMKKTKKVTYTNLAATIKSEATEKIEVVLSDDVTVYVKPVLSFEEVYHFVDDVANIVVDKTTGEYRPQAFEYAMFAAVMNYYAGVPLDDKSTTKAYDALCYTDIREKIVSVINARQFSCDICLAIEKRIEFEKSLIAAAQAQKLNDFIAKMEAVFSEGQTLVEKLQSPEFADTMKLMAQAAEAAGK